jgi:KaiC/GvpD/RAD55 family RecA-like ATPase
MADPLPKISTGIAGLDEMLRGGFVPGRSYMVSGISGSGKTTFGIQFLQQGVRQGERALLVSIDEPPQEIRENVRSLGWDVGKIRILDVHPSARSYSRRVSLVEVAAQRAVGSLREAKTDAKTAAMKQASPDLSAQSLQLMLRQEFLEMRYSRIVIDSLTSLKRLSETEEGVENSIVSLFRFLSEWNVTTVVLTDLPDPEALEVESLMCRGEVRLHKLMISSKLERCITVEKLRGSAHDTSPRPMRILETGIEVDSHKKLPKAVLSTLQAIRVVAR